MEDYYVETCEHYSIFKSPDHGYYWQGFVWFETIEECRASIVVWNRRFETALPNLGWGPVQQPGEGQMLHVRGFA